LRIAGSVALVTGAAAGLGWGIAERLAADGASLVLADVDGALGRERAAILPAATFAQCDVTVDAQLEAAVHAAQETFGGLDILVNNAGGAPEPQYPDAPFEHWSRVLDLNLRSVMRATQLALPLLAVRRGVVVNISSSAAIGDQRHGAPAYAAAKAAIVRFTTSTAEIRGVRINAICPDWIDTPSSRRERATMTAEQLASLPPILSPAQVAAVVVGLIEDDMASGRVVAM
jgi:3-oxoacyl-[acyl-carrier protein] reductase